MSKPIITQTKSGLAGAVIYKNENKIQLVSFDTTPNTRMVRETVTMSLDDFAELLMTISKEMM